MVYIFMLIMLGCGYYTLTYGISLWRDDNNKLGGFAAGAFAVIGTIVPGIILYMKS
ncbi:MAG TPA: hypothetical protein VF941_08915 [Clostridia bacterium]